MNLGDFNRMVQPMKDRIMLMVARGVLKVSNDAGGLQTAQVSLLEDELRDRVERAQDYGLTSNPLPGAEAVVVFVGGNRDHGLIIKMDDRRFRLKNLKGGEVALYTDEGDFIHFKRDRNIEVKSLHVVVNAEEDYTVNTKKYAVNATESIAMTSAKTGIKTDALDMSNQQGGEVRAKLQGGLDATDDVTAHDGNVSLRGHEHDKVQGGNDTTGKPVGG